MSNAGIRVTDIVDFVKVNQLIANTSKLVTVDNISDEKALLAVINITPNANIESADITVTDNINKSDADTINAYNISGNVTITSITDSFSNISSVQGTAGILIGTALITATDAVTLENANSLNGFTNAQVTLNAVQDTVSNIISIDLIDSNDVSMASAAVTVTDPCLLYTSPSPRD